MNQELRGVLRGLGSRLKAPGVFPGLKGRQTVLNATNYMNRVFGPAVERAGIENLHWHTIFATPSRAAW
jgi:hypothetical protein